MVAGRPSPYMVHRLMHLLEIESAATVVKAGDSMRDIGEGLNAGCGQTIGVLSGADSREDLQRAGAHAIAENITRMPLSTASPMVRPWTLP